MQASFNHRNAPSLRRVLTCFHHAVVPRALTASAASIDNQSSRLPASPCRVFMRFNQRPVTATQFKAASTGFYPGGISIQGRVCRFLSRRLSHSEVRVCAIIPAAIHFKSASVLLSRRQSITSGGNSVVFAFHGSPILNLFSGGNSVVSAFPGNTNLNLTVRPSSPSGYLPAIASSGLHL